MEIKCIFIKQNKNSLFVLGTHIICNPVISLKYRILYWAGYLTILTANFNLQFLAATHWEKSYLIILQNTAILFVFSLKRHIVFDLSNT